MPQPPPPQSGSHWNRMNQTQADAGREAAPAPSDKRPAPWMRGLETLLLLLLCAVSMVLLTWRLDRQVIGVAPDAYFGWWTFANALPALVAVCLVLALTRRPVFSFVLVAVLQALVYYTSNIKLAVLGDPLGLQDLYFVTHLDRASFAVLSGYVERPVMLVAALLVVAAALAALWRVERPAFRVARATQVVLLAGSVFLLHGLAVAGQPWKGIYDAQELRPSRFEAMPAILHGGLMSSLVYTHKRNLNTFQTYDEQALRALVAAMPPRPTPVAAGAVRPDIVVVLSESLFDPRILKGMDALPDVIPNLRAEIERGRGGTMAVPAYGGGTVRTEFEVLTGMPMAAFPAATYPYVTLVRERIPSLVSQLKRHGYSTVAIHGNAGSFWNRTNTYKAIGFDKFIDKGKFPKGAERDGRYLSDAAMTDLTIRELEASRSPTFVFALSMQAHGPYEDSKTTHAQARDAVQVPPGLDRKRALELRNYLYHIGRADHQFGRLLEHLRSRTRPAVVLFFGDHLPALPDTFKAVGFIDATPANEQLVPWAMIRTDMPGAGPQGQLQSWMLPGNLLELAGLGDDPYFALTVQASKLFQDAQKAGFTEIEPGMQAAAVARLDGSLGAHLAPAPARGAQ